MNSACKHVRTHTPHTHTHTRTHHTHTHAHTSHTRTSQPEQRRSSFPSEREGEDATLPPPSEQEQQQMALFWAMEEANSPKGWDEEKELDYSEVVRRREEQKESSKSEH